MNTKVVFQLFASLITVSSGLPITDTKTSVNQFHICLTIYLNLYISTTALALQSEAHSSEWSWGSSDLSNGSCSTPLMLLTASYSTFSNFTKSFLTWRNRLCCTLCSRGGSRKSLIQLAKNFCVFFLVVL